MLLPHRPRIRRGQAIPPQCASKSFGKKETGVTTTLPSELVGSPAGTSGHRTIERLGTRDAPALPLVITRRVRSTSNTQTCRRRTLLGAIAHLWSPTPVSIPCRSHLRRYGPELLRSSQRQPADYCGLHEWPRNREGEACARCSLALIGDPLFPQPLDHSQLNRSKHLKRGVTAAGLLMALLDAKRDGSLSRALRTLQRVHLLIDELGYIHCSDFCTLRQSSLNG